LLRVECLEERLVLASTFIPFTPPGNPGTTYQVYSFDESPGNALALGALAGGPVAPGKEFDVLYQATMANLIGLAPTDPPGTLPHILTTTGLNNTFEITVVARFREVVNTVTTNADGSVTATFILANDQPNNFIEFWVDTTINANNLAGTGFNDGTLGLTGTVQSLLDVFTIQPPDVVNFPPLGFPPYYTPQPGQPNPYAGDLSVEGTGAPLNEAVLHTTAAGTTYFPVSPASQFIFTFATNTTTPFGLPPPSAPAVVPPSELFVGNAGGVPANVTPNIGPAGAAINGVTGTDFQFLADANSALKMNEIQGQKFADLNGNGIHDANEPGIDGVTMELFQLADAKGNPFPSPVLVATTTTAGGGFYQFVDIGPGTYTVREVPPAGTVQTTPNPGSIVLTLAGSDITGINFGNFTPPPGTPPPPGPISGSGGQVLNQFGLTGGLPGPVSLSMASKLSLFGSNMMQGTSGTVDAAAGFVAGLYHNVLNRAPDTTGLVNFVNMLQAGIPRSQVAQAFWESPEHRTIEVDQFFANLLGRTPDAAGLSTFVNAFLAGASEVDVMRAILLSPEYQATHMSDMAFVTGLFTQVLGRSPDAAGLASWLQALQNGTSRQAVAQAFLTSTEEDQRVVEEYYLLLLGRAADATGEQPWVNLLSSSQATFESVAVGILASNEYFARVG
jgi:hypothetical protein